MSKSNKKLAAAVVAAALLIGAGALALDSRLKVAHYSVKGKNGAENFRIALITDLHSCVYGENQSELLNAVRKQDPDIVLFGGDIFDDFLPQNAAVTLLEALGSEYECYFVSGNHEAYSGELESIKEKVQSCGITVLDEKNGNAVVPENGGGIVLYGFDDQWVQGGIEKQLEYIEKTADNADFENSFNILLIHRPEHIEEYAQMGFDLVLSGHAHGGQWRVPGLLNGLYAPDQGLFPKYAGGFYQVDETVLVVSRGLARESHEVPRIFNRPELVIIDIE